MPVTWSCWKTSHLAEDTLLSWATNPDSYSSLADYAEPCRIPYQYLGTTTTFAAVHKSGPGTKEPRSVFADQVCLPWVKQT